MIALDIDEAERIAAKAVTIVADADVTWSNVFWLIQRASLSVEPLVVNPMLGVGLDGILLNGLSSLELDFSTALACRLLIFLALGHFFLLLQSFLPLELKLFGINALDDAAGDGHNEYDEYHNAND